MLDILDTQILEDERAAVNVSAPLKSTNASHSRRLPRIKLPKFSGEYAQWSQLRDLITSMILGNNDLSDVEKLHYLKMSLTVDAQLAVLVAIRKVKTEYASDLKQLLADVKEALGALEALNCPVCHWDYLITFMVVRKLDPELLKDWEKLLGAKTTPPNFDELEAFLVGRIHVLEALEHATLPRKLGQQLLRRELPLLPDRIPRPLPNSSNLCLNCLGPHPLKACRTWKRCRICRKQHHSILHNSSDESTVAATPSSAPAGSSTSSTGAPSDGGSGPFQHGGGNSTAATLSHVAHSRMVQRSPVLLATAIITVRAQSGESCQLRALLDQGSETSFISKSVAQCLKLSPEPAAVPILGIGAQRSSTSNGRVSIKIFSRMNSAFSLVINALVLPKLTAYLPLAHIEHTQWPHIVGFPFADPNFAIPGKIDLVLGASVFAEVLEEGRYSQSQRLRFWDQEEVPPATKVALSSDEVQCEEHFITTHSRNANGRFVVRLPVRMPFPELGDSRTPARNTLLRLERQFKKCESLKVAYLNFLRKYLVLDHMRPANVSEPSAREFFLPHHGVVKDSSSTTKLRVVFNGSQKTNLGISLNDCLLIGPKLQTELDWPLQKILWRDSPREPIREYHLCTVTYGLTCAPYLALRCLRQLSNKTVHSLAAEVLRQDTYVDNILSGADRFSTTKNKIQQLRATLKAGGFNLRKRLANSADILSDVSSGDHATFTNLLVGDLANHYMLGLQWDNRIDCFAFSAPSPLQAHHTTTKRALLSCIARIFDPLGWIAPINIIAKKFLQELWAHRLDWDDELSYSLRPRWNDFTQQLEEMPTIVIPRWFGTDSRSSDIELHGFSDASQVAIAAVVYLRVTSPVGIRVSVITAKAKVAPLKRPTIPRLELSAAVLLVKQILKIRETLDLTRAPTHLWSDSAVALAWIKSHPSRWKEFVKNCVAFIQECPDTHWHHISGKENPADLASRGVSLFRLKHEEL
ncbi:uncharacterized protein LOC113004946 [Solenopsis invicta]|uniref:uncharacterized protein LOC113004946 n=1 Tax=Solenopsis invicta TaxID=13686 RepID=UPI000E33FE62|nr:uncharacterized protein LOC113004946 [Solenopsis invicta]